MSQKDSEIDCKEDYAANVKLYMPHIIEGESR